MMKAPPPDELYGALTRSESGAGGTLTPEVWADYWLI